MGRHLFSRTLNLLNTLEIYMCTNAFAPISVWSERERKTEI